MEYWSNVVRVHDLRHCAHPSAPLLVKQLHLLSWPPTLTFKSSRVRLYNFVSPCGETVTDQFQRESRIEGMSWRIMSSPRGGWRGLERLVFQAVTTTLLKQNYTEMSCDQCIKSHDCFIAAFLCGDHCDLRTCSGTRSKRKAKQCSFPHRERFPTIDQVPEWSSPHRHH